MRTHTMLALLCVALTILSVPGFAAETRVAAQTAGTKAPSARKASAQTGSSVPLEKLRIPHKKFVLDNGLTLVVAEDHSVPLVAVNLWYHVGSRNEKRGKSGFAHLFEHFFFNGSENYPHGFREAMDDLGANNRNGSTSPDRTNFFEDIPVSALERTLYLEADRMGFLAGNLSPAMLERERGIVQNEKRQRESAPYGKAFSNLNEVMYPYTHPYWGSTIGVDEDVARASMDDVKEWYRTYYGPNNCVLTLAGDITPERALELVTKYFGGIPPGPPLRRVSEWVPRFERNIRDEMQDRVPQTRIYRVWHAPAWGNPQYQHIDLLAAMLTGSKSARLDRRLIYEKDLATDVSSFTHDGEIAGRLFVSVMVKPGVDPAVVERELDAVLADLAANGPTADELQRAQSRTTGDFVRNIERLGGFGGRADILSESTTYTGKPDAYLDRLQVMAKATPADVKRATKQWVVDPHHYTLIVTPFPKATAAKDTLDRKILPSLGEAPEVRFPEVQRTTLANGLNVMLLERHSTPLAVATLAVDAGSASDAKTKAGAASLALEVMEEGTKTRSGFQLVDELDAHGAAITTSTTLDHSFVRLSALSASLGPSLELLADVVLNPAFAADKVELRKRQRIATIGQEKADARNLVTRVVPGLLYGENHGYALPGTGSGFEETVTPLTRDDLATWHRAWFHPNNATLIVVGDVTMAKLKPELERAFGVWRRGEAPKKNLATVPRSAGRKVYLIDKPDAAQSMIGAAVLSESGGQPEDLAMETVMRAFGGMATSRLNRNLRLDKHWSYGVTAQHVDARGQRPIIVYAPVQTDKTKESLIEVAKELREIAGTRPIAGEEYASMMRNQTMRLPGRFETLRSLELAAIQLLNYGYPADYFSRYAHNTRALNEASLASAAKKFVRTEDVIWVVVGDLRKIEAGIRELNLGEIVKLEPM